MAANHDIPVEALQQRQEGDGSIPQNSIHLRLRFIGLFQNVRHNAKRKEEKHGGGMESE